MLQGLFTHIRRLFAAMPLAALVERNTLILHGGLFRAPPTKAKTGAKRRRSGGECDAALSFARCMQAHDAAAGFTRAPHPLCRLACPSHTVADAQQLTVGTLDDLRAASKGAQDPDPDREW
jgi:hypothetical protein